MADEERAEYLAAAERLEAIAAQHPFKNGLVSGTGDAVREVVQTIPIGPAMLAISWFLADWRAYYALDIESSVWMLQAAALKLRAMVEESCLG